MTRTLRVVAIESLRLPGDWLKRLAAPHVRALADSGDILNPPAMRKETREVIHGGDRLAAMWLRGEKEAEVWVYGDLTDDQVEEMRATENAYRRDPDLAARARLVAKRTAELAEEPLTESAVVTSETEPAEVAKLPRGPRPSAEGQARAEVAAATGVSKNALEKQASRERHKDDAPVAPPSPATPGIEVAIALDELDRLLMAGVTAITKLAKAHPELTERFDVASLKWKLQREVAPGFRAMRPQDRCPYCKCWPSEMPNCGACKGSGWIVADQLNDIPKELLAKGAEEGIYVGGEFITLQALAKKVTKAVRALLNSPDVKSIRRAGTAGGQQMPRTAPPVPLDHTRTALEDDFSDAWTGDEK